MDLTRRGFIGGLLATAAVRTWPFRVYSFASGIELYSPKDLYDVLATHEFLTLRERWGADGLISTDVVKAKDSPEVMLYRNSSGWKKGVIGECFGFDYDDEVFLSTPTCS